MGTFSRVRNGHQGVPKLLKKAIIDPFVAVSHPACLKLVDQCGSRLDQCRAHPGRWFGTICSCRNCHLGVLQRSKVAKIGHKWGVTLKNQIFTPFWTENRPWRPTGAHPATRSPQKYCHFDVFEKLTSVQKKQHFWPKNGLFWAIRARKQPARQPNEYLPENQRYPKLPPVMGKL